MKIVTYISLLTLIAVGCKKEEPTVQQQNAAPAVVDTTVHQAKNEFPSLKNAPPPLANYVRSLDQKSIRTAEAAAKLYLTMPDSVLLLTMPPRMRPFKNLHLSWQTDSMAFFGFSTAKPGLEGQMHLVRSVEGGDTIWIPLMVAPGAPPKQP